MQIRSVAIENFRGIKSADIQFDGHALIVGPNNTAKTTVLEALDLALGPDRNRGFDTIDEHDFFRGSYYDVRLTAEDEEEGEEEAEGEEAEPQYPEIRITVVLGNLSRDEITRFRDHLEPWDHENNQPLSPEQVDGREIGPEDFVLRVGFRGWYDPEEDDFDTASFFLAPERPTGDPDTFGRRNKQAVGFLYLRSVRTARRAATLERGSLLETLLRERTSGTQLWEALLRRLRTVSDVFDGHGQVRAALDEIESSISELVPLSSQDPASGVRVARLTRRHLRETLTYFLASRESQHLLPFDRLGSGTSNVLVFALLAAIARAKSNVIFAMEEPEIALAPHTQRAIVEKLRRTSAQAIVTSHSPYVAELFLPDDLLVIRRDSDGEITSVAASSGDDVKAKVLRTDFRTRFAEGMLANFVVLVEGVTELWALPAALDVLSGVDGSQFRRFDLEGAVFIPADGSGEIPSLASYFSRLGIGTLVFCDQLEATEQATVEGAADTVHAHPYRSFEKLVATELPIDTLRRLVRQCETWPRYPRHLAPLNDGDEDDEWRDRCYEVLSKRKGEGWAARFIADCEPEDLPSSVIRGVAVLRAAIGHSPLPATDVLASVFRAAAPESVEDQPTEEIVNDAEPNGIPDDQSEEGDAQAADAEE